jgi:putative DNA primase/helicase
VSASTGSSEFVRAMGPVARELLGKPTEENKTRGEIRFGTRGSLCVSLKKGTWFDNETEEGGGLIDFVQAQKSLDKDGAKAWLQEHGHIKKPDAKKRIVATYDYVDREGKLVYQVVRYEPKDFRQRRPDGNGGWVWKMAGVDLVLYRLPSVDDAVEAGRTVFIAEGEKAVHAVESIGLVGTCSPGGAGKWKLGYNWIFEDSDVVILADNDPQKINRHTGEPMWHPAGPGPRRRHSGIPATDRQIGPIAHAARIARERGRGGLDRGRGHP